MAAHSLFYALNMPGLKAGDLGSAYQETYLEASPLDRPVGSRAAGSKSAAAAVSYGSNTAVEVKRYDYAANANLLLTITQQGNYAAGTLYKKQLTDEQARISIEYTDLSVGWFAGKPQAVFPLIMFTMTLACCGRYCSPNTRMTQTWRILLSCMAMTTAGVLCLKSSLVPLPWSWFMTAMSGWHCRGMPTSRHAGYGALPNTMP